MLKREENELVTRVSAGTPMGTVMRRYWIPAMLASEVPAPDSDPVRVRLLGENLIGFRDSNGSVGLVAENCPHRGASLFFGRNEECGLRCVYHGWKFDASGQCIDMPNEPAESDFKTKVQAVAYPTVEKAGVVWTYMGPAEKRPPDPNLEWMRAPEGHAYVSKTNQKCNWLQAMEGGLDTSHSSFYIATWIVKAGQPRVRSTAPRLESAEYGLRVHVREHRPARKQNFCASTTSFAVPTAPGARPRRSATSTGTCAPIDDGTA
jgi:phenylpropionate dioxygenase-like ring-hydroxylating dioxygenase large terminal subunit